MLTQIAQVTKEDIIFNMAIKLLKPQNRITNLEIKNQLRKDFPDFSWKQEFVHDTMDNFYRQGYFIIADDNGTYRTYADPTYNPITVDAVIVDDTIALTDGQYTKAIDPTATQNDVVSDTTTNTVVDAVKTTIDANKALSLMQNNSGHFFTAFVKENGNVEVLNCQYVRNRQDLNAPNSVVVKLRKKAVDSFKTFELSNLTELSINKQSFVIA